jgi:hypothetical protein
LKKGISRRFSLGKSAMVRTSTARLAGIGTTGDRVLPWTHGRSPAGFQGARPGKNPQWPHRRLLARLTALIP